MPPRRMLWQKGESAVTIRELCEKEVVQLEQGVCLGRADDLEFDPATAQLQCLILLGRPCLLYTSDAADEHRWV